LKAYVTKPNFVRAIILLFVVISAMGCSSTRFLQKDEVLVRKIKLKNIDLRFEEQAYEYVQRDLQKPSWLNLRLYILANTKHGKYRTKNIKKIS